MAKALIVYATRMNQTRKIAELIAQGLRAGDVEPVILNVTEVGYKGIKSEDFDAIVLGSATYHGEMMQSMKTFLFSIEKVDLAGKIGGAFGAYGWSGEAPGRIFDTMQNLFGMQMVSGPLRVRSASDKGAAEAAESYGRQIAEKVTGGGSELSRA